VNVASFALFRSRGGAKNVLAQGAAIAGYSSGWMEHITNEEVLAMIGEERGNLNGSNTCLERLSKE